MCIQLKKERYQFHTLLFFPNNYIWKVVIPEGKVSIGAIYV